MPLPPPKTPSIVSAGQQPAISAAEYNDDTNAQRASEVQCNMASATKLDMGLEPMSRRGGVMDDDTEDPVIQLCTRMG